jgi:hypothetical protein
MLSLTILPYSFLESIVLTKNVFLDILDYFPELKGWLI